MKNIHTKIHVGYFPHHCALSFIIVCLITFSIIGGGASFCSLTHAPTYRLRGERLESTGPLSRKRLSILSPTRYSGIFIKETSARRPLLLFIRRNVHVGVMWLLSIVHPPPLIITSPSSTWHFFFLEKPNK